jgi:hypothetical protein
MNEFHMNVQQQALGPQHEEFLVPTFNVNKYFHFCFILSINIVTHS